jgi:hypothetical protein
VFGHDNRAFVEALQQRGFAVAGGARANYLKTHYSLASTLNMQYLDAVMNGLEGRTTHAGPLYRLMENSLVAARLKELGYQHVHLATWWDGTRNNPRADLNLRFLPPSFGGEFSRAVMYRAPLLSLLIARINPVDHCRALKEKLSYLETAGGGDQPTFVFAHVLAPHSPILTDAEGNCIPEIDYPDRPPGVAWSDFARGYAGFVTYLNRRLIEIFDRQKAENPNPLIFVLQADEGPYPRSLRDAESLAHGIVGAEGAKYDWRETSDADLATKFGIMNALYLGEQSSQPVPATLGPVNNWRLIFGRLEGRNYPLLPERQFIYPTSNEPYRSIEITNRLDGIPR